MPTAPVPSPTDSFLADGPLRTLLDVSLTAIQFLRPLYGPDGAELVDFGMEYLNPAGQRMLGLPEREPASMRTRFPHTGPAGVFEFYRRVFETGAAGRYDVNYQADGLDNYFRLAAQRSGPLLVVSFTDTADHGRSDVEQALRDSQAREQAARAEAEIQRGELARVLEQAPVAMAVFRGPQYVVELANPAVCALWGRTPAQAVGTPLFELLPEAAGQGFEELLDGVLRTGEPFVAHELPSFIDRHGRRDTVYWNFVYQPLRAADGRIAGVTVVANDVSEQVEGRARVRDLNQQLAAANAALLVTNEELRVQNSQLRHTQQRLQRLNQTLDARVAERTDALQRAQAEAQQQRVHLQRVFAQAPVSIVILRGPGFLVELANDATEALWGRPAVGRPLFEALPDAAGQGLEEIFETVLQTGEPAHLRELPVALARGRTGAAAPGYFTLSCQPLRGALGETTGVIVAGAEVTEQVLARQHVQQLYEELTVFNEEQQATNEELSFANEQLTRANADLDAFVYTASHDLKDPINNIEGLLQALHEELPPAGQVGNVADVLGQMQGAVDRFKQTLGQLADIPRLQEEEGQPSPPTQPADVVRDVLLDLAPLIAEAGAQLDPDLKDCPLLNFSEKNLRSVVYNLLSNALKYRHPDRPAHVRLSCRTEAPYWVLEVQDNGLGLCITPERPLFALFQRYHSHVPGSGVGLYMVKKMLENAGGKIEVQSQLGVGSTFSAFFKQQRRGTTPPAAAQ